MEIPLIQKNATNTESEARLYDLCLKTFLRMWCYPSPYRHDAKELCDVLVVFGNHVILFSDKHSITSEFHKVNNIGLDWTRWYKKYVYESAKQLSGAYNYLKENNAVFLDATKRQSLPHTYEPDQMIIHCIVVAHGIKKACMQYFSGGSGSLIINTNLHNDEHMCTRMDGQPKNWNYPHRASIPAGDFEYAKEFEHAFEIGIVNIKECFCHVLDDVSFELLLNQLDTISDFVEYIQKRERLFRERIIRADGEEDLLASYLRTYNDYQRHDFVFPEASRIYLPEGYWNYHTQSQEYASKISADRISYQWDNLIDSFYMTFNDLQNHSNSVEISKFEIATRIMASPNRVDRRLLAKFFLKNRYDACIGNAPRIKVIPLNKNRCIFVFLAWQPGDTEYQQYRKERKGLLEAYCCVSQLKFPNSHDVIGIAIESVNCPSESLDLMHLDTSKWGKEEYAVAEKIQNEYDFLRNPTENYTEEYEYPPQKDIIVPDNHFSYKFAQQMKGKSRNSPCACGSGKKAKKCCLLV
ncbi:MAG: YecA family protein [Chloroflexota bacterium]|jgi:hypothetical protein